jgi:hypothetical protein
VKRSHWIVLALVLAGPGCLSLPHLKKDESPPVAAAPAPPPAPPAVSPEQVNDKNARDQAQALRAEINHDLSSTPAADSP